MQNKRTAASAALLSVLGVSVAGPVGAQVVDAAAPLEELGEPIVVEAPASLPPFSATLTREERMASVAAFQASDYRYGDAVVLSDYWAVESTYQAKVKAGALLLDGYELPFDSRAAAHDAYTASDLTWADSVALGEYWGIESSYEVRIKAGFWLLDGYDPLEIFAAPTSEQLAIDTFFGVGYDYDDAVALADYWGLEFPYDAKIKAGLELKAGAELPPVAQPSVAEDFTLEGLQLDAFFNAGYDYADAVALADFWGEADTYEAKLKAGALIKAGLDVPTVAVPGVTDADLEGGEA